MPKAGDMETLAPNILLIGDAGTGKSSFLYTLGDALEVCDTDGNIRSAISCGDELDAVRKTVEVVPCHEDDPSKKATAFKRALDWVKDLETRVRKGEGPKVVGQDSLTTLVDAAMRQALSDSGRLNTQPQLQDWGVCFRSVEGLLQRLKSLPIPFVQIAHDVVVETDSGTEIRVAIPGKTLSPKLPRLFSDIWYMKTRAGGGGSQRYEIYTVPKGSIKARASAQLESPLDATQGLQPVFEQLGFPLA